MEPQMKLRMVICLELTW